jgi:hypothetical protein
MALLINCPAGRTQAGEVCCGGDIMAPSVLTTVTITCTPVCTSRAPASMGSETLQFAPQSGEEFSRSAASLGTQQPWRQAHAAHTAQAAGDDIGRNRGRERLEERHGALGAAKGAACCHATDCQLMGESIIFILDNE